MKLNIFSISLVVLILVYCFLTIPSGSLQIINLTRGLAISALGYLFLSFVIPVYRKQLGIWCLIFAVCHAGVAFFGQFGGFAGLVFLPDSYLKPLLIGLFALILLIILVFLRFKWAKYLVYILVGLVCIHLLMIGTHFIDISRWPVKLLYVGISIIVLTRLPDNKKILKLSGSLVLVVMAIVLFGRNFGDGSNTLSVHSQHIAQAQKAQVAINTGQSSGRRFTVSFDHEDSILPNKETPIRFVVYDASTGNKVNLFSVVYEKLMHMIVVDSELKYFSHIHPTYDSERGFEINTSFPHAGIYHIYVDFTPIGEKSEQQFGFTLPVGQFSNAQTEIEIDKIYTKQFGKNLVELQSDWPLKSSRLSLGQQTLTFKFDKANLWPYLGTFGHLVMINTQTFEYVHIHPRQIQRLVSADRGGPTVEFLPLGVYGPIRPGTYRLFGQFMPDGQLTVVDFTVKVEE